MDQLIKQLQMAAAAQAQVQGPHPHAASALQLYAAAAAVNLRVPGWSPFLSPLPDPGASPAEAGCSSSSVYMLRQMALMQRANAAAAAAAMRNREQPGDRDQSQDQRRKPGTTRDRRGLNLHEGK